MSQKIDLKGLIPSGNELRVLLNSYHISDGDINTILKGKGIFCGSGDKITCVPLLAATLLTSDEYARIIDNSISRSSKPKNKQSRLSLTSENINFRDPIKNLFSSGFNPFENIPNIEPTKKPNPTINGNTIKIKYQIKRNDFSKDFLNREIYFDAEISIENKGSDLKIELNSIHTSKETEIINRRILNAISKKLKDLGVVTSEIEEKITFNAFKDVERVRFFKRLTAGLGQFLQLDTVEKIVISREATESILPDDPEVSWMNETVRHMTIDGEKLHKIFLISDEKYYQYYFIDSMDLTYQYAIGTNLGKVKVAFFFSSSSRKRSSFDLNSELTFELIKTEYKNATTVSSRKKIEKEISEKIRILIQIEYEKIIKERRQTPQISDDEKSTPKQKQSDLSAEDTKQKLGTP